MQPVDGSVRQRKVNETHWHAVRCRKNDLTSLPPALGKGRLPRVLAATNETSTHQTAASVEALDERRLGFSTRRPGQGRRDFECKPPSGSPCRGCPPERLAPRTIKPDRSLRPVRLCLY